MTRTPVAPPGCRLAGAGISCRQRCFVNRLEIRFPCSLPGFMEESFARRAPQAACHAASSRVGSEGIQSLVKRDEPMREVRPEQGDSAVHLVSRAGVERRLRTRKVVSGR